VGTSVDFSSGTGVNGSGSEAVACFSEIASGGGVDNRRLTVTIDPSDFRTFTTLKAVGMADDSRLLSVILVGFEEAILRCTRVESAESCPLQQKLKNSK
jgi:hypothetical protein